MTRYQSICTRGLWNEISCVIGKPAITLKEWRALESHHDAPGHLRSYLMITLEGIAKEHKDNESVLAQLRKVESCLVKEDRPGI
jgi:hypothetical protein